MKVFISYSWDDEDILFHKVVAALSAMLPHEDILYDKDKIAQGNNFRTRISDMITKCDCVVALMTHNALQSVNVFEELVMARERNRLIIPLVCNSAAPNDIPYFFTEINQIRFSEDSSVSLQNAVLQLERTLDKLKEEKLTNPNLWLFDIRDKLHGYRGAASYQNKLIDNILKDANREVGMVLNNSCEFNIGIENNFLLRATPIFSTASEIYAVSLTHISTFWTDSATRQSAIDYLNAQPQKNVHRLFVFKTPEEANYYKDILRANENKYGQHGGVYLCSFESYKQLLKGWNSRNPQELYEKDFGYLIYEIEQEKIVLEAELNHSLLKTERITNNGNLLHFDEFRDTLLKVNTTTEGDVYTDPHDEVIKIVKWSDSFLNPDRWAAVLKTVFCRRIGDAMHLVCFKIKNSYSDDISKKIQAAKVALDSLKTELRNDGIELKDVWFGQSRPDYLTNNHRDPVVRDIRLGELKYSTEYDFLLMMRFSEEKCLKDYYQSQSHSDIRQDLYRYLDQKIRLIYDHIDQLNMSMSDDQEKAKQFFSVVEELASSYVVRHDFVDVEDISSIARLDGYRFM